jgi:hypothetical protein
MLGDAKQPARRIIDIMYIQWRTFKCFVDEGA